MSNNLSYFDQRMQLLGITPEINTVKLWEFDSAANDNVLKPRPVFTQVPQGIEMLVYTLDRRTIRIEKSGSKIKKDYSLLRLEHPTTNRKGDQAKYIMPKGHPTQPFFPPALLDAYDNKTPIPVLYITEGYFKAFKAAMHGIMCVGVPSITCLKNKDGELFGDVLKLVQTCRVERLVWLTDGDCRNLTTKEIKPDTDLSKRPFSFFQSVNHFHNLTSKIEAQRYFAHINSDNLEGKPKGLDDLLIQFPDKIAEILEEATSFNKMNEGGGKFIGTYFVKMPISYTVKAVHDYFHLTNADIFYMHYVQQRPKIKEGFVFFGTQYEYDEKEAKCKIVKPAAANKFIRVGDHYYEKIIVPDIHGNEMTRWDRRDKTTITDDYKKEILQHIPKYRAFQPVPDHINYQQIILGCFNSYHPFEHQPDEGDCTVTLNFFKHIFGTHTIKITRNDGTEAEVPYYELGLDYFALLYKKPQHILPILCLASKENGTGKSTFVKFLKYAFGQNAAIVSNEDLANPFNSHWAGKLLVMCEETKIDKDNVVEKVKALSTGSKVMMNAKGRDQIEIDFFAKFIFCTNNEDSFLPITENDVRYWVIKVPKIPAGSLILDMDEALRDELPAFLHYINRRQFATDRQFRHWFNPAYLRTQAMENVIKNTQPQILKKWWVMLENIFSEWVDEEGTPLGDVIQIPTKHIAEMLRKPDDEQYIRKKLQEAGYKAHPVKRGKFPTLHTELNQNTKEIETKIIMKSFNSSYYEFKREDFAPDTVLPPGTKAQPVADDVNPDDVPF